MLNEPKTNRGRCNNLRPESLTDENDDDPVMQSSSSHADP